MLYSKSNQLCWFVSHGSIYTTQFSSPVSLHCTSCTLSCQRSCGTGTCQHGSAWKKCFLKIENFQKVTFGKKWILSSPDSRMQLVTSESTISEPCNGQSQSPGLPRPLPLEIDGPNLITIDYHIINSTSDWTENRWPDFTWTIPVHCKLHVLEFSPLAPALKWF